MDHESLESINNRLDKLELKSQITEHILNRLRYLTDLKTKDEYKYTEILGRIEELEEFLTFFNNLSNTKNQ